MELDAQLVAVKLERLIEGRYAEMSKVLGVPESKLRRWCTEGLSRLTDEARVDLEKVRRHFGIGTLQELLIEPTEEMVYAQKIVHLLQLPMHPEDKAQLLGLIDGHCMAHEIWDRVAVAVGAVTIVAVKRQKGRKTVDLLHWAFTELVAGKTPDTIYNAAVNWIKS